MFFNSSSRLVKLLTILLVLIFISSIVFLSLGIISTNKKVSSYELVDTDVFHLITEVEDEYTDESIVQLEYTNENEEYSIFVDVSVNEDGKILYEESITGNIYLVNESDYIATNKVVNDDVIQAEYKEYNAVYNKVYFGLFIALLMVTFALFIVTFGWNQFTTYEKIWFTSIIVIASIVSIIFPEESANGVSGIWIMFLYLLDTFLNILCELLISKQSKWNFIVSIFVEIAEILICIVLAYRFATMITTLFFWLPIDIISFINWHKHPDEEQKELTNVRKLSGWMEVLIIAGIVIWTVVVGYFLSQLDFGSDFIKNKLVETIICYLDACASAVGIVNGIFIFFRLREQWIAWYICAALEAVINIMSGQFVLLVLKVGYFTNTTYGYIKWTKYIKSHKSEKGLL